MFSSADYETLTALVPSHNDTIYSSTRLMLVGLTYLLLLFSI